MTSNQGALLGFSGKIASGKSAVANAVGNTLYKGEYVRLSFSQGLKDEMDHIISIITRAISLQDAARNELFKGIHPDKVINALRIIYTPVKVGDVVSAHQRTPDVRKFLQTWGTEVRRDIDNDYWVKQFISTATKYRQQGLTVISDDVRFPNEADAILDNGGKVFRLDANDDLRASRLKDRDGEKVDLAGNHPSETGLDNYDRFSYIHVCSATESLEAVVSDIAKELP